MADNNTILGVSIDEDIDRAMLFGNMDVNIRQIENVTGTSIIQRGDTLKIRGDQAETAAAILQIGRAHV